MLVASSPTATFAGGGGVCGDRIFDTGYCTGDIGECTVSRGAGGGGIGVNTG